MVFFDVKAQSQQLEPELTSKFCGYAKTSHLQRAFEKVGCDRHNPNRFISGDISAAVLQASL
ncbi:hypothetical protein F4779DRAFT_620384 [Xylariaceae sp. FL0662B]|nr:hypothetical protein F4779DRAFT_620384 [Xylariaceae sp. FL0662B]